ncbi:uncharacterized protein PFL1_05870 [Pseudozyma flocculosa PF-1]|uniref:Kinetochore protein Sos7 coiled-coil domain-containing protein n=2 Tax=Pseudozyma flocculosa TaxID=84751 RepID=A0A5C3F5E6_9BASI|nr:uncharacterized protein PFL1_05870 [Pseudozyma flocculosa PF-1]EPQ26548.1 hypothetical protein PFL1_05870 [Pseudozyma flocculosa PF-1]SPO38461.1 uncharacterized protein PSFLO_03939 [Pseudozyma flocculosa]
MPPAASPNKTRTRASTRRRSSQPRAASQQPPQPDDDHDDQKEALQAPLQTISATADDNGQHEDDLKSIIAETKTILASLGPAISSSRSPQREPLTAFEIAPEHLSLHTIRDQLLSKSDRKRSLFGANGGPDDLESPSKRRRSSLSQIMGEGDLDIDWATYKDWPEGVVEEESMMLDYFRKLKFIYLEQETKMRFLADVQDDIETGTEATVYSAADVAERERVAKSLKSQLVEAKSLVRSLRAEVDAAAEQLVQPWQQVEQESKEAERLIKEIGDMELELAKIRAQSHGKGNIAAIAGREGPLTTAEAEEVCDAQIQEMTTLEEQTTKAQQSIETTKKQLVTSLKSLDRLNAERSTAEKYAAEAKLGMGRDGGRDLETEQLCATHTATLALLRSLLGIEQIEAVDADQIKLVYRVPAAEEAPKGAKGPKRRSKTSTSGAEGTVTILLRFEEVGGRVAGVEIRTDKDEEVELSEAAASRLRALQEANDVPLMVQEVLSAF